MAKRWTPKNRKAAAAELKRHGRGGDSDVVHVNAQEKRLLKRYGGAGTTNPQTGLKEYYGSDVGGPSTKDAPGGGRYGNSGLGRSNPGKGTSGGNKKNEQSVPTQSAGPTAPNDTFGSPESAAAANASLGSGESMGAPSAPTQAASEPKPSTFTPMDKPKPMGATEYREGADALGVAGTIASGIAGNAARALAQGVGLGDKDPLKDHIGKQTGWHLDSEFGGKAVGGPGTKGAGDVGGKGTAAAGNTSASSTSSSTAVAPGASAGGQTITVNPDGTIRYQDTSVAGLRAQRRYGAAKPQ